MSNDNTTRRERPEKTIGPETFTPEPAVKHYAFTPVEFKPPAGSDIVTQAELIRLAEDEEEVERLTQELQQRKQAIIDRLRSGKGVVEPGAYAASVKENLKQKRVSWRDAFIEYNGEDEAKKLENAAKSGPREVSSYGLELKKIAGGK